MGYFDRDIYIDGTGKRRIIQRSSINAAALGSNAGVPAQGAGIKIRVLGFIIISTIAQTVKFLSGASAISADFPVAANGGVSSDVSEFGWFETNANEALNVNLSAATATGIQVIWVPVAA